MKAVLVLNGVPPARDRLLELSKQYPVYAADGGSKICMAAGVRPQWVVGDFDSQDAANIPADWERRPFPEQDRTDFQKLLATLPEDTTEMLILGGLGARLDHQISNLLISMSIPERLRVIFEGEGGVLHRVTSACPYTADPGAGVTVSLLPLSRVEGVQTHGLKWNLDGVPMGPGLQLGQSNLVEGPVNIIVKAGQLYLWVENRIY